MKTITMQIQKSSRPLVIVLAIVVAIITSMVTANAVQTITTPNAALFSYTLTANTSGAAITPVSSRSVLVMGCCTASGVQSVGQVSLINVNGLLTWVGLESYHGSPAAITQGNSAAAGNHIVYIDFGHVVDIQTASANTIRVHNGAGVTATGNVTLIW